MRFWQELDEGRERWVWNGFQGNVNVGSRVEVRED